VNLEKGHIVIVGCARRIGLTLTQHLLEAGYLISGTYHHLSPELIDLEKQFRGRFKGYPFDLRKPESAKALAQKAAEQYGPVFGIIHVASQFYRTPLEQVTPDSWDELFDTNVKGHFFLTQAFIPHLAKPSHIINLVDIFAFKPLQGYIAYTAAKGALLALTRNLANELAPHTRVNAISPGPVLLPENFTDKEKFLHASRTLLKRTGSPQDIWNAVRFFLDSAYITGMNLCVDGGSSLV